MAGRALILFVIWAALAPLRPFPSVSAAVAEGSVEFQDGAGNIDLTLSLGQTAQFYVRDAALGTVGNGAATWTDITAAVSPGTWWSLATGAPPAAAYSLDPGSSYSMTTPSDTPLNTLIDASVDGVDYLFADIRPLTGEFKLLNTVNALGTLQVQFSFDVIDTYPAADTRVRVTSASDAVGEWLPIVEVASELDTTPHPTTGLLRGQVLLRGDPGAATIGDGAVWAQGGDSVTVTYFDQDGATEIASHQATVDAPPPVDTPTPANTPPPADLPSAHWLTLALLASALAAAYAWPLRRTVATAAEDLPPLPQGED